MADREPMDSEVRLSAVTPGAKSPDAHAQHDRWLVVRAASHDTDLTLAETADARALLDGCVECAGLAADITTISRATAESIVPTRPRDFRLTPALAASARGGVMERLGRWLWSPRGAVVRPLAGATLAIGLVLIAVGPSIRAPLAPEPAPPMAGAVASMPAQDATSDPALTMEMRIAEPSADPAGITGTGPNTMVDTTAASDAVGAAPVAKATADPHVADIQALPGPTAEPEIGRDTATAETRPPAADDTSVALTLLGIVLAGTAALVLLLTWMARRMTRHEPLR